MPRNPSIQSLTPPLLGLVRLRIPGFAALRPGEQLQAGVLALNRDLSINAPDLMLAAVAAPDSGDQALVAYCQQSRLGTAAAAGASTQLLGAMRPGVIYWADAPGGYVLGESGSASVEHMSGNATALPSVVAATISSASTSAPRCILVNRNRALVTDDTVAHWAAASGAEMLDGALPEGSTVTLVAPPRVRTTQPATALDRGLQWSALAALACAVIAGVQFAGSTPPGPGQGAVDGKRSQSSAGALFERVAAIAPDAASELQSATYAGGAWVITLPDRTDAAALARVTGSLAANGLRVQSTASAQSASTSGPRLRVQLP